MPLDQTDPHYALGFEHGQAGEPRYEFADVENQRRYLIGYEYGRGRRPVSVSESHDGHAQSLAAFEQLARRLSQQPPLYPSVWYNPGGNRKP